MPADTHLRWNVIASVIALAVALAAGPRVKAILQSGSTSPAQTPAATSASEHEAASAEHASPSGQEGAEHETSVRDVIFQWANFLLIAGGVWFLGKKYAVPFLKERAQAIREDMARSARALAEGSQRLAHVEKQLKRLDEEIRELRQSALQEAAAERARIDELARAEANKIVLAAEQEIAAAAKTARRELKVFTADLAVGLAEKRIRETISGDAEKRIFRSFVKDLGDDAGRRGSGDPSAH